MPNVERPASRRTRHSDPAHFAKPREAPSDRACVESPIGRIGNRASMLCFYDARSNLFRRDQPCQAISPTATNPIRTVPQNQTGANSPMRREPQRQAGLRNQSRSHRHRRYRRSPPLTPPAGKRRSRRLPHTSRRNSPTDSNTANPQTDSPGNRPDRPRMPTFRRITPASPANRRSPQLQPSRWHGKTSADPQAGLHALRYSASS